MKKCDICGRAKDMHTASFSSTPQCENPHCIYLRTLAKSKAVLQLQERQRPALRRVG